MHAIQNRSVREHTDYLVADIERLREHLGIDRWLVHGASWGSTLALAYAERQPARVTEMVIAVVTMTAGLKSSDVPGVGRFFPAEWTRFRDGVPAADRDGDLVEAYARLLPTPTPVSGSRPRGTGATGRPRWSPWIPAASPPRYADARFRMAFARIITRYFGTERGSMRASCCVMRIDSRASRRCSSMAHSISAARSLPRGNWLGPGLVASSSCSTMQDIGRQSSGSTWSRRPTASPVVGGQQRLVPG